MAIGLLASASHGLAVTMTWTNGSDLWTSATAWTTNLASGQDANDPGFSNVTCIAGAVTNVTATCTGGNGVPGIGDHARFTNNTSYTVTLNITTNVGLVTFSNTAGTVTIDAGANTLTITNRFRVADGGATSTVVWAGGTLSAPAQGSGASATLQIGTAGTNSVGTFVVANGTIVGGGSINLGTTDPGQVGKLVIGGPGVFTNVIGEVPNNNRQFRLRTAGSQLMITNGGKFFWRGAEVRATSNSLILVSGPGSFMYCTNVAGATAGALNIGALDGAGPGSLMIVSNGATIHSDGSLLIGRGGASAGQFSAFNTGIVVGAGSKLITGSDSHLIVGSGSIGGSHYNNLTVYDGGYLECGGTFFSIPNSNPATNNSFNMGGVGAVSTGLAITVRNNSGAENSSVVVTNAVFTCTQMNVNGIGGNTLTILAKGTLNVTGPQNSTESNSLAVSSVRGVLTINAGTVNASVGSNNIPVTIGGGGTLSGCTMTITNGGKLLSELGTIGVNSSYNTGIVTGAGSVWSNWTSVADLTNRITVGGAGSLNTGYNYLAVRDGAKLYNNGTLSIGTTNTAPFNSVVFGGVGDPSYIRNQGSLNIGGGGWTQGNTLLVTNATLDCDILNVGKSETTNNTLTFKGGTISVGFIKVRVSNTVVFTAGTLSAGGMDTDPGANGSNIFVVGDGTSTAYYDMAAGGTGYHVFGSPGLVVTNNAFLRGSGTLTGTLTVLGTFVPGFSNSVGSVFTSNSLSFGSSALNYDLGTNSDSVTVNGNLGLGSSTLYVTDSGGFGAGTYVLFQHTNTVTAPSGTITVGGLPAGFTATVSNDLPNAQVLLVVTAIGGGDPYTTWTSTYGLGGANAAGGADPDGDGMSNTNEFLAGFNPTNSAASLHIISVAKTGNDMKVTYLGANGDSNGSLGPKTNVLEFTTGTANGSYSNNFASTGQTNILTGGSGLGAVTNSVDVGGGTSTPSRYYRVRVLVP